MSILNLFLAGMSNPCDYGDCESNNNWYYIIGAVVLYGIISLIVILLKKKKKRFLEKISKYKINDIIYFGDYGYYDGVWKIKNIRPGKLKNWSPKHFIVEYSDKEYYMTWDDFDSNVTYDENLIKVECEDYMIRNNILK